MMFDGRFTRLGWFCATSEAERRLEKDALWKLLCHVSGELGDGAEGAAVWRDRIWGEDVAPEGSIEIEL